MKNLFFLVGLIFSFQLNAQTLLWDNMTPKQFDVVLLTVPTYSCGIFPNSYSGLYYTHSPANFAYTQPTYDQNGGIANPGDIIGVALINPTSGNKLALDFCIGGSYSSSGTKVFSRGGNIFYVDWRFTPGLSHFVRFRI